MEIVHWIYQVLEAVELGLIALGKVRICHPGIICERLEERIVLDAAVATQVDQDHSVENQQDSQLASPEVPEASSGESQAGDTPQVPEDLSQVFNNDLNVVLVSNALDQIQGISDSAAEGTSVIVFDEKTDDLNSVCHMLEDLTNATDQKIGAIAIVSHASEGYLSIGTDDITFFNVSDYESLFKQLSPMLAEDAQIQFFGCSVSSDFFGESMVDLIARYTGADVFASTDATGGVGGNWDLEYTTDDGATMKEILVPGEVSDLSIELAEAYPAYENNWATALDGVLYYAYDDGIHGNELWRSNGTADGTWLVADINRGAADSDPTEMLALNGVLYFAASDGNSSSAHGVELWKYDPTTNVAQMVADINLGNQSSDPGELTNVNGILYFHAMDGTSAEDHGVELWRSDGTEAGTEMVKDINPGNGDSNPTGLTNVNGILYFSADDGSSGNELWESDGSADGTWMVADINRGNGDSDPGDFTDVNGTLYFHATDGTSAEDHGMELWKYDPTTDVTEMVADINLGNSGSDPGELTNVNGTLYFHATDGTSAEHHGVELWKYDPTTDVTEMVKDINPGNADSNPSDLTNVNGTLYFTADDGSNGIELWKSDGSAAGTVMVLDINSGGDSIPRFLNDYDGVLLFAADDGVHGYEVWKSDPNSGDTFMVKDINPFGSSFPMNFARVNPLFFLADAGNGYELWKSDGTVQGTVKVSDVVTNGGSSTGDTTLTTGLSLPGDGSGPPVVGDYESTGLSVDSLKSGALFTTSAKPNISEDTSRVEGQNTRASDGANSVSTSAAPSSSAVTAGESTVHGSKSPFLPASDGKSPSAIQPQFVPGMMKVIILGNGDYSINTEAFSVVIPSGTWLPPMVSWYLGAVSEGRYRFGSLPAKYERMILDFLRYIEQRKSTEPTELTEMELQLAWQWAQWRKQVLKEHGDSEVLPWSYFRGLSKALTAFYGDRYPDKLHYSKTLTALRQNASHLSIIPIQLPEETLPDARPGHSRGRR